MKSVAIMQPYFFPYIGYFSLMHHADEFVLFDTAQYDRKGWMNRNRVLKPVEGWQYIRAGVLKPEYRAQIKEVRIDPSNEWKEFLFRQLEYYRKVAPYFNETADLVHSALSKPAISLTELNRNTLEAVKAYLGVDCKISIFSEMDLVIGEVEHSGQWALRIAEAMHTEDYINPAGGKDIFVHEDFVSAGIALRFLKHDLPNYAQGVRPFEPGLSIIDVMMFNSKEKLKKILRSYLVE